MTKVFKGTVALDVSDSEPDWAPYLAPKSAAGAPNVLIRHSRAVLDARTVALIGVGPPAIDGASGVVSATALTDTDHVVIDDTALGAVAIRRRPVDTTIEVC